MQQNNLAGGSLRIAFNGIPLLSPLTGIGQYTKNLLSQLDHAMDLTINKFYRVQWDKDLPQAHAAGPSSAKSASRWKSFIRQAVPGAYTLSRTVEQHYFSAGVKSFKPDLYHEPSFLAYQFDGPTVITVHDLSWIRYPEMHPVERVRAMDKYFEPGLRRASRIITDSVFVKQELIQVFGVPEKIIHPVLLGADKTVFMPMLASQTQSVLTRLNLEHGQYLLAVGTLEPRKNLQLALHAFMRLPKTLRSRYPLVLVGMKGWHTSAIEVQLQPLIDAGEVRQLGYLSGEDLAKVIAGSCALVFPSVYEGFGLPPLEAMTCGVPVIASNTSSVPEVVGDAGILFSPDDVDALTMAMMRIVSAPDDQLLLGQKALARSGQFSWTACASQTHDVYRLALSGSRSE